MSDKRAAYLRYQRQRAPQILNTTTAAAKRVFAQPQLLENILLGLYKGETVRGIPLEAPVTKLFALQRVNSAFQTTIQGSIALTRLMWLYPPEKKTGDEICASKDLQDLYMGPLEWLFKKIGNPLLTRDPNNVPNPFTRGVELTHRTTTPFIAGNGLANFPRGGFERREASWRKMVAFHVVPDDAVWIKYAVIERVEIGLGRTRPVELRMRLFEGESFRVEEDDTLGAVSDKWAHETGEKRERQAELIFQYVSGRMGVVF